jgi:uncharacterized membrane protein YgaE (UPF0421/DUF939 family)
MLSEELMLKTIVESMDSNKRTTYSKIKSILNIDDFSMIPFLKSLSAKHYIIQSDDGMDVTDLGISQYNILFPSPKEKFKKLSYNFTKHTFQRLIDIFIGVIIGLLVAFFTYHFGWQ